MKLGGVMIGSEKPKELAEFYTKFLGKPGWEQGDWFGYDIGGGNLVIGPHSEVKGMSETPERIMISFESADVPVDFKRIAGFGAKAVAEPYHPDKDDEKTWLATLADPDGNYLQLMTPWKE